MRAGFIFQCIQGINARLDILNVKFPALSRRAIYLGLSFATAESYSLVCSITISVLSGLPVFAMITRPLYCQRIDIISGRKNIGKILQNISFIDIGHGFAEIQCIGSIGLKSIFHSDGNSFQMGSTMGIIFGTGETIRFL